MKYVNELKSLAAAELICGLQYKMAAEAIVGPGSNYSYIKDHCEEHCKEEFDHYGILVAEIMKADESPEVKIQDVIDNAVPELDEMKSYDLKAIQKFFIKSERATVRAYCEFYKMIEDDPELVDLCDIISQIISDEKEHELDFRRVDNIKADLEETPESELPEDDPEEEDSDEADTEDSVEEDSDEDDEEELKAPENDPIKESNKRYLFDFD